METLISLNLPLYFSIFITIYLFGYFIIFQTWKSTSRAEASSCLISLAHGTPAALLAMSSLFASEITTFENSFFASKNTDFENMVLEYSIAYFTTDLLHYFIFIPNDTVFIAHHLATLYVFTTCRYIIKHGGLGILVLLFLAEVTSFCQNTWTLARIRRGESPVAAVVAEYLSPWFYFFYFVVRGILGPIFVFKMGSFYFGGWAYGIVAMWAWASWLLVIICALYFSNMWVLNLLAGWLREREKRRKLTLEVGE